MNRLSRLAALVTTLGLALALGACGPDCGSSLVAASCPAPTPPPAPPAPPPPNAVISATGGGALVLHPSASQVVW